MWLLSVYILTKTTVKQHECGVSLLLSKFRNNLLKVQIIYTYQHPKTQGIEKKVAKHNSIITTSVPTEDGPPKNTVIKEWGKRLQQQKQQHKQQQFCRSVDRTTCLPCM